MQSLSFGDWLKHKRKAFGLTQAELASQVGCSAAAIRKLEAEERRPSAQIVERLAEIFEIPQDQQTAFLRFARGDVRAMPSETKEDFPWQASAAPTPSNLPATVTSLIGRQEEIADIQNYFSRDDIRLVTLIGPPGIGKTRLSLEVARRALSDFPDGVFFIALAPLDDPSLIVPTILQALNFVEMNRQGGSEQLSNGIRRKQMLLVLDNCEHLIEEVASLVSSLLSTCPRLKVLTTSRESLRIPGEWVYTVPAFDLLAEHASLDVESVSQYPALALFVERARAVRADFSLTSENIETITAICARLDGLPLVIELMAARMRLMSPQELLDRLTGQFMMTADGMRAASERQKTLQHAIDWSYRLLQPEEQKLFAWLSVFAGSFSLETVEAMIPQESMDKRIQDLMASLLDKSLLKRAPDFESSNRLRYTMLVTLREYAHTRLQEMGEEMEIRNRHLTYYLRLAEKAGKELRGPNQFEWLRLLDSDRDNLRAALDWAIQTRQTELALRLVRNIDWFWFIRSDHLEGRQWLDRVLKMPDTSLYREAHAEALYNIAHHIWLQSGYIESRPYAEQALSLARKNDDKLNIARALSILGLVLADEKNFSEAQSALEESMALYRKVGDEWGYAHAMTCLGEVADLQGDLVTALSLREQVLILFRKLGDRYFETATLSYIGIVQVMLGNSRRGTAALRESLTLAQQLDSKYEIAMILKYFAMAAQSEGKYSRAVYLHSAARNGYKAIGAWQREDEIQFQNDLVTSRAALGESAFAEAETQGRAMPMEQAIAYALDEQE
jgi:predicted ATPase/DNA-binding XRE family transcriptional regulator